MINYFIYLIWLIKEILLSGYQVAKIVWTKTPVEVEKFAGFASIKTLQKSQNGMVVYSNSITLTPGTVTVSLDQKNNTLLVHALNANDLETMEYGAMDHKIQSLLYKS